jgi:hypothetical protein
MITPHARALQKLWELRVVLDRLSQTDNTLYEAVSHDVEEAIKLTDDCIAELSREADESEH